MTAAAKATPAAELRAYPTHELLDGQCVHCAMRVSWKGIEDNRKQHSRRRHR